MNESYDVKGRVRRIEQRQPGTRGLENLPDHRTFDVEFSPSGKIIQLTSYTGAKSVRGYERFSYDSADRLTRSVELDSQETEKTITEFAYNATGFRLGSITRDFLGTVIRRSVEEYAGNILVSDVSLRGDGSMIRRKEFDYVEGKLLKSTCVYFDAKGEVVERWVSSYDGNVRLAETSGLKPDGTPLGDGRYRYQYDEQGRESQILSFNDFVSESTPNHIRKFAYSDDKYGNWIERREDSRFESESKWRETITTRKLSYYD
jgi:hypothetical protein